MRREHLRRSPAIAVAAAASVTMLLGTNLACDGSNETESEPAYGQTQLRRDVDAIVDLGLTGVQAQVRTPGRTFRARAGVADVDDESPMPWNGYYRIGSDTKTFVATVVLQLVDEGMLSLDDTVDKWLPGLVRGHGNDGRKVTVRHLLRHNSGLPEYYDKLPIASATTPEMFRRERFEVRSPEELVGLAIRSRPSWIPRPGERRWEYSNTNYVLAAMIIAEVTGHSWEQEVHERIIEPLGLRHTFPLGTAATVPQPRATFYLQFAPGEPWTDVSVVVDGYGDGGLVSTTADMTRFHRALLGGRLLDPASLTRMRDTVPAPALAKEEPGAAYGLGLIKRRLPCGGWVWYHNGLSDGVASYNGASEDGRRAVALVISSLPADPEIAVRAHRTAQGAVDRAICGTG